MNKILVLFDSATGNVQQMAELSGKVLRWCRIQRCAYAVWRGVFRGCRMVRWPRRG